MYAYVTPYRVLCPSFHPHHWLKYDTKLHTRHQRRSASLEFLFYTPLNKMLYFFMIYTFFTHLLLYQFIPRVKINVQENSFWNLNSSVIFLCNIKWRTQNMKPLLWNLFKFCVASSRVIFCSALSSPRFWIFVHCSRVRPSLAPTFW